MITQLLKFANIKFSPKNYLFGPEWIVLGVNNVCNLHCKMCDVGTKNMESNFAQNLVGTHPLNMPLDLTNKIIDQTAKYYPKAKLAYAFTEPLVYPHLVESLKYASEKKLFTTITTNALTLSNKADLLVDAGLNEIYISLDGPEEIHNDIRGHKKSFQKAIEGIQKLKANKNCPKIAVICAITQWNIGYLKELISKLLEVKVDEIGFMHTQFITNEMSNSHNESIWGINYPIKDSNVDLIDFSQMDLDLLFEEIMSIKQSKYPCKVYFSPNISTKSILKKYYLEPEVKIGTNCNAVYTSIMIKSDGSVIPAHGRCYNLTIGNIYEEKLSSIWESSILKNLRKDLNTANGLLPGCNRCCSAT